MTHTAAGYARSGTDEQDQAGRGHEFSGLRKLLSVSQPTGRIPRRGKAANLMTGATKPHIMSTGHDSAGTTGAGLAAEVAGALLIATALVHVTGTLSLAADIRRGRERHRQDVLIGKLWAAVERIPAGTVLDDPLTGSRVSAERDGGFLILAISDPPDHPDDEATIARYTLGYRAVHARPPLYRHLAGIHDMSPAWMGWQQRERLAEFNAITGAAEVTTEELAGLLEQVTGTTAAHFQ